MANNKSILRLVLTCGFIAFCIIAKAQAAPDYKIRSTTNTYQYSHEQIPGKLELMGGSVTSFTYQWEKSLTPLSHFSSVISGGSVDVEFVFTEALTQTAYYRCVITNSSGINFYSNTIKIEVVSVNWEDYNYTRVHTVNKPGVTDWKVIDKLPIGVDGKLQTTSYTDGLGRSIQSVSRGTATPTTEGAAWGDMVGFSYYDAFGRQSKNYLPYTTTDELGKYKIDVLHKQPTYYNDKLGESSPFSEVVLYDNSPLNRARRVKSPGASWADNTALGNKKEYELNIVEDAVHIWKITDYTNKYSVPDGTDVYPENTLFKFTHKDENDNKVVEFVNKSGQLILKKVELIKRIGEAIVTTTDSYTGWICTYYVYDDFGRLHCTIEPEAVNHCNVNNDWTFASGYIGLEGYCYFYAYDEKGRMVSKRPPGASELKMLYDKRDRLVFTQDGNQRAIQQWTANLYDELDRPVITTLYNTTQTETALQTVIDAASSNETVSVVNAGQPIADLVVDTRTAGITQYAASNSVELVSTDATNFESSTADEFTVEIDASIVGPTVTTTTVIYNNPITTAELNNPSITTVLKYQFYDSYSFTGVHSFDNSFDNTQAYATNGTTIKNITTSARTISFPTGSKTRVLNTNTFITETTYFDDDGQPIQSLKTNIKEGIDITTFQYHYDGRLLSVFNKHSTLGTGYTNFGTLTKNFFDNIGRITSSSKKYGSNDFVSIASFEYDDIGRLKSKKLSPDYDDGSSSTNGLETLNFSYNIRGQLTGINKDYALKATGFDKWSHYFGLYLGYDNRDAVFDHSNLTGQLAGVLWTTQGDDAQRKYDYTYDNAGRLTKALFNQKEKTTDSWSNNKLDFSVKGLSTNGDLIDYDLNGNLKNMLQRGVIVGEATPLDIDKLAYSYFDKSNKLKKVTDNGNAGLANGSQGDFKDGANGSNDDYEYDANGNVSKDLNKGINTYTSGGSSHNSIKYNFLDKPEEVHVDGKGIIKYVYDASGSKLQKIFTPDGSSVSKITTYINQFTYEETKTIATDATALIAGGGELKSINFEEGRIRTIQLQEKNNGTEGMLINGSLALPNDKRGVFDYFIKDHLASVRMVLTEEVHQNFSTCNMDDTDPDRATNEQAVFGSQVANTRFNTTSIPTHPWTTGNHGNRVSKLSQTDGMLGPNSLQKVMAGDEITTTVDYFYENAGASDHSSNLLTTVLQDLGNSISNSTSIAGNVKNVATNITTQLGGSSTSPFSIAATSSSATLTVPRAFLNVLFFDERFNFVEEGSQSLPVNSTHDGQLVIPEIKAPKNGYVYIYLSNESTEPVYFDRFRILHKRGRILEENHYYAFGLKIAGISSNKLGDAFEGKLDNESKYQGEFSDFEEELAWNDFELRTYDPQIGRWLQQDPYEQFSSPYVGMGNDPVNNVDEDGGFTIPGLSQIATNLVTAAAGAIIGGAIDLATGGNGWTGASIGTAAGYGAGNLISGTLTATVALQVGHVLGTATIQAANVALSSRVVDIKAGIVTPNTSATGHGGGPGLIAYNMQPPVQSITKIYKWLNRANSATSLKEEFTVKDIFDIFNPLPYRLKDPSAKDNIKIQYIKQIDDKIGELETSNNSLQNRIAEHEQRLKEYQKDPDKHDHQGKLKDPLYRDNIIKHYIKHLQDEIKAFKGNIIKNNEKINKLREEEIRLNKK